MNVSVEDRPTSKLAGASLIFVILAFPAAVLGWAARGSDSDWLWPYLGGAAALLALGSIAMALGAIVAITHGGRVKGAGYAVVALMLNLAGIVWLAWQGVMLARGIR
jgi:hypothetical protein